MQTYLILNGPNLNLTGIREPEIYGNESFDSFIESLRAAHEGIELVYRQSNVEGELINYLQEFGFRCQGIIFNPGGYAHTSVAIADAIRAITCPVIEVHLSNVFSRENYRQTLITASSAEGCISGFGFGSYRLALQHLCATSG